MSDNELSRGSFEWIKAGRLTVDPAYQRPRNETKIRKIVAEFDPDAFGVLYVSRRETSLLILDGQQRHSAVMEMGWDDQKVPCYVYVGLDLSDEARLFREYNELRTRPRPLDLHKAAVVEGQPRAVAIEKTLAELGLSLVSGQRLNGVQSVAALQAIIEQGDTRVLRATLQAAIDAWGRDSTAFQGEVLLGIAVLLARYPRSLDRAHLVKALHRFDPTTLLHKSRILRAELMGSSVRASAVIAQQIIAAYNWRLSEERRLIWQNDLTGHAYWVSQERGVR